MNVIRRAVTAATDCAGAAAAKLLESLWPLDEPAPDPADRLADAEAEQEVAEPGPWTAEHPIVNTVDREVKAAAHRLNDAPP